MTTSLTLGDILSFTAIIFAVQAISITIVLYIIGSERKIERNINEMKDLNEKHIFLNSLIMSLVGIAEKIKSINRFTDGIVTRLLHVSNMEEEIINKIHLENKILINDLEKDILELSMYSEAEIIRLSAFKNLSEYSGDIDTIDKMDKIIKYNINNITTKEKKLLLNYKKNLKDRIKNATETTRRTVLWLFFANCIIFINFIFPAVTLFSSI